MADMALIQGAVTGLKTAADIAKGFLNLHTMAEVQGKVIDLQSAILTAQSSALAAQSDQFSMIQEIRDLKEEIARIKAWEETKQRYALHQVRPGIFVYALKDFSKGTEPPHWICTKCYEDKRKAVLQKGGEIMIRTHKLVCLACMSEIPMPNGMPDITYFS